jgi:hypothetical protein
MQRCPKCGYREKYDWPALLMVVGFALLYVVFILAEENVPRSYRLAGTGSFSSVLRCEHVECAEKQEELRRVSKVASTIGHRTG